MVKYRTGKREIPGSSPGQCNFLGFFLFEIKRQKAMEYKVTWLYVIVKNAGFVSERFLMNFILLFHNNWAATWQNQQRECASSEESDQPGHPPGLIRVFAVRMKKPWVLSYPLSAQRRLWSDWADAHSDQPEHPPSLISSLFSHDL